ncbi:hypothetical protein GE061_014577 [Apolygus lucorum]|uniref:C2H2-type domain-containing protein n=1 Tax=Apolygus lucorum TaxID=248454 RepID=A0A8S9XLB9_APOLU|nr:hypothetical protein GE061_014577 [Apolygus lucorum]
MDQPQAQLEVKATGGTDSEEGEFTRQQEGVQGGQPTKRPREMAEQKEKAEMKRKRISLQRKAKLTRLEQEAGGRHQLLDIQGIEERVGAERRELDRDQQNQTPSKGNNLKPDDKRSLDSRRFEKETESEVNLTTPVTESETEHWETVTRKRKVRRTRKARTEKREKIMSKKVEIAIDRSKKQLNAPQRSIIVKKPREATSLDREMEVATSDDGRNHRTYAQTVTLCSPKTVKRQIRETLNAREEGLQIDGIRPMGASQIKVVAATPEQALKVTNRLADAGFIVEKERLPDRPLMVKIRRVDRSINKDDLASYIYEQNPWVRALFPHLQELQKVFVPFFQMGRRMDANGVPYDDCIWVVRISEALRKEFLKQGRVYISLDTCPISDFTEVTSVLCAKSDWLAHLEEMADEYFLETAFPQIPEFHFLMMEEDVKASLIKEQEMFFSWYPDVTDTKQYKCDTCTYATSDRSNFTKHLRVHTGGKPYGCYACDYKTDRRYLLNEHVRIHTGEKPFKCDHCAYATKDRSNLSKHLRTHTGERPYRCKLCNYSTANRFSLKSHMRTHTGGSSATGLTQGESSKDYDDSE